VIKQSEPLGRGRDLTTGSVLALAGVVMMALAVSVDLRSVKGSFIGDEAVYYAMADSLAHDHDLRYTQSDLQRLYARWPAGPQGLLMAADPQQPDIIHYAKPVLYSLVLAPWLRVFGDRGIFLFHMTCLLVIIALFAKYLGARGPLALGVAFSFVAVTLSAVLPYAFWITPELAMFALNFVALWLGFYPLAQGWRECRRRRALLAAFLLAGISAYNRPPNAVLLLPLAACWWDGRALVLCRPGVERRRRILFFIYGALAFVAGVALLMILTKLLIGGFIAHGGFRKRFVGHFPFEAPGITFLNTGQAFSTENVKFVFHWQPLAHNLVYFWIGRFTGIIPYFFPAVWALYLYLRRPSTLRRLSAFIAFVVSVLFHLILIPTNYHGGSGAIGNRYFLYVLPLLLFLVPLKLRLRDALIPAIVSGLFIGPIALQPIYSASNYAAHTSAWPFQWLPAELTLINSWPLDGPKHARVDFGPGSGYFLYFADDNTYGKEEGGFWVKGAARAGFALRSWKPENLTLTLRNGPVGNSITARVAGQVRKISLTPGQTVQLAFNTKPSFVFYNLAGDPSWVYWISIRTDCGFVPKFTMSSQDPRYLGVFASICAGQEPRAAAIRLLDENLPAEALEVITPVLDGDNPFVLDQLLLARARSLQGTTALDQAEVAAVMKRASTPEERHQAAELALLLGDRQRAAALWRKLAQDYPGRLLFSARLAAAEGAVRPAAPESAAETAVATYGDVIELLDFTVTPAAARQILTTTRWRCARPSEHRLSLFVHILPNRRASSPDWALAGLHKLGLIGRYRLQDDHDPLGAEQPTTQWRAGEIIVDQRSLDLPAWLGPGDYGIWLGWWNPASQSRLLAASALPLRSRNSAVRAGGFCIERVGSVSPE